jgi:hypothetical protein
MRKVMVKCVILLANGFIGLGGVNSFELAVKVFARVLLSASFYGGFWEPAEQ